MADGLGLFRFADARDEEDLTETTDSDTAMDLRFLATKLHNKNGAKGMQRFSEAALNGLPPLVH